MTDGIPNVDSTVLKLAEQYQACNVRSRGLNDERKQIRDNVDKLGIDPSAFTVALSMTRDMTAGEREDYSGSLNRVLAALDGREADLFGQAEVDARNKRAAKREAKAAGEKDKPDNPRGDPAKGGAGGVDGKKKAKDATPKPVEPKVTGRRGKAKSGDNVVPIKTPKADKPPVGDPPADPPADEPAPPGGDAPIGEPPAEDEGRAETGDELISRVSREKAAELEQREGAALLDGAIDHINGTDAGASAPVDNDGDKIPGEDTGEGFAPPPLN